MYPRHLPIPFLKHPNRLRPFVVSTVASSCLPAAAGDLWLAPTPVCAIAFHE